MQREQRQTDIEIAASFVENHMRKKVPVDKTVNLLVFVPSQPFHRDFIDFIDIGIIGVIILIPTRKRKLA